MNTTIHFKPLCIFFLITGILLTSSCEDKEDPDGQWSDIIKLSTKSVELTAQTDSAFITTKGDWWWIENISFEDSSYSYYDWEDINLEADSYVISEENFVVERRDKNTLFIKLNANTSAKERSMSIVLEAGDYFDYVSVTQAAE